LSSTPPTNNASASGANASFFRSSVNAGQEEWPRSEAFGEDPHPRAVPGQEFEPGALAVNEAKDRAAFGIFLELIAHPSPQPVERLPHIHGLNRHVDPDRRRKGEHHERNAFTSATKSTTRPPRSTVPSGNRTSSSPRDAGGCAIALGNCTRANSIARFVDSGHFGSSRCTYPAIVL
jgi:hypothetical protein